MKRKQGTEIVQEVGAEEGMPYFEDEPKSAVEGVTVIFHFEDIADARKILARLQQLGVSNDCQGHLVEDAQGFVVVDDVSGDIISTSARYLLESALDERDAAIEQDVAEETMPTVYALMPTEATMTDFCEVDGAREEVDRSPPGLAAFLDDNLLMSVARGELTVREAYRMQYGHYFAEEEEEDEVHTG